jgi:hypothetical protein
VLAIPRVGLALIVLAVIAWLGGVPYLLARLGFSVPVALDRFDGPHIYVGLVMACVLVLKVAEIRARQLPTALSGLLLWHRWLSVALLLLWGSVFASGLLALLPWPATLRQDLVEVHLMASVWASVATIPHVFVHLRRLPWPRVDRRLTAAIAVILLPALALAMVPRAVAPFSQLGAGQGWVQVAHQFTYRLLKLPDGRIAAAGTSLLISRDGGSHWHRVRDLSSRFVFSVAAAPAGHPVYVGAGDGLFSAPDVAGPYRRLGLSSHSISVVFVEPGSPRTIWAGSEQGLLRSANGGVAWTEAGDGLVQNPVYAMARHEGVLYAGTAKGVYRWDGETWHPVLGLPVVMAVDPGPAGSTLWASSMGGGLYVQRGGRWTESDAGMPSHGHGGGQSGTHVEGFSALEGHRALAATMLRGVAESLDGGASWYSPSPGLRPGAVWALLQVGDHVLAATDTGVFVARFPPAASPGPAWWLVLVTVAVLAAVVGSALGLGGSGPLPMAGLGGPRVSSRRRFPREERGLPPEVDALSLDQPPGPQPSIRDDGLPGRAMSFRLVHRRE